ncbi:hypothetical protein HU200_064038 [Digitaria exilis]|uniref:Major facilitator superfamily (MFS) profile domain-containing protein n=1 Tax=Digitaria exilis TaxID=1010633 RepID=A0A835A0K1_9POAL|nr:hypothetical protein HU200_064038 [Digitaria exilis]CAB3453002.1 unnamed protein product [Digitaria exilis]
MEETGAESARRRRWTLWLVIAAGMLECADETLLPSMYKEVGSALGASPAALGSITMWRTLVQALCYPLATCAAARFDRALVVAAGTLVCAVTSTLVGASATFLQMAIARGLNGIGMALVLPPVNSLIADYSDDDTRGFAFGWVYMVISIGAAMGTSISVLLAPTSFLGIPGWRLVFHAFAILGFALALSTWHLRRTDSTRPATPPSTNNTTVVSAADLAREAMGVLGVPSFWIIVAQDAASQVPWSALTFMAMWLELVGLTHWETTVVTTLNCLSNGLGSLLAGVAGDLAARRFPDTGRIAVAQVSNASIVPVAAFVLLLARPGWPLLADAVYAGGFLLLGVAMGWSTVSTSNPIFAEIVPEKSRTTVYALDLCFQNVVGSFGAPIVGILAERVFGYRASGGTSARAAHRENAAALGKAVFVGTAVPAIICSLTYTALYCTYPADRRRVRIMAADLAEVKGGDEKNSASLVDDGLNQALLSLK